MVFISGFRNKMLTLSACLTLMHLTSSNHPNARQ